MKKYIYGIMGVMCATVLSGCGSEIPDLTEEQTALVTEYATNLLVKYSEISNRNLLDEEELEIGIQAEEEERVRKQKADEIAKNLMNDETGASDKAEEELSDDSSNDAEVSASSEPAVPSRTISEFFAEDNFSVDYVSYLLCESYPEASDEEIYMAMEATQGKQLCILKFVVKNLSSSEQPLDMFVKQGKFSLRINNETTVRAQSTLLVEDLSSYAGVLPANAEEEMVLVFEVSDSLSQISSMQLHMSDASGENVLTLQ